MKAKFHTVLPLVLREVYLQPHLEMIMKHHILLDP